MACEDIPSISDLEKTKLHADDFGRLIGGTESGYSTNGVTGKTRPTYDKTITDLGFKPGSGDFTTGFTVQIGQRNYAWYDPISHNWYSYLGNIPESGYVVAPGTNPVGNANWKPVTDEVLREDLASANGYSLLGEFDAVADLKAFPDYVAFTSGARISVKSYYAGLGVGGGFFRWNPASTDADDGGYTINPMGNAGAGRWKREAFAAVAARTVCPLEFGAKINDSTFDSAPMINKAISYLNPYLDKDYDSHIGGDVVFPAGVFYINDTVYGAPNVRLLGTGGSPGFRFSRAGCACIAAMPTMDPLKIMFDTAPWLKDNSQRYKTTNEMIYGRTESDGYYGSTLENLVFIGQADTQCGVRIWRVPTSRLNKVAVFGCKVSYWINGSWDVSLRDCFAFGAKYATNLIYQCTAIKIFGGYFTGNQAQLWSMGTPQWFHRAEDASNKPNIAYVTTFMYALNSYDINTYAATIEYYNRPWALFFCGNVNQFGGYSESLGTPASESGHRVYAHCVASEFFNNGVYFNHDLMDAVVQSGNLIDGNGDYIPSERSKVEFINPRMVTKFVNITKDLGYGSYNIVIDYQHYITEALSTTLASLRLCVVQFRNILDQYTMRIPTIVPNGTTSFSFTINNLVTAGDYEVHFIFRNVATTLHQDIRFNMLIGTNVSVTGYEARSRVGTATFPAPTATFDGANTVTITFQGNSGNYSVYRVKCVPREAQNIFMP